MQRDFSEFLASLNAARVKYLVVGAYALAVHGAPRNTLDLDVFVQPTRANGARLVTALAAFGLGSLSVSPEDFAHHDRILQLGRQPLRIDILTSISGVTWAAAWKGRLRGRYGDVPTLFLGSQTDAGYEGRGGQLTLILEQLGPDKRASSPTRS